MWLLKIPQCITNFQNSEEFEIHNKRFFIQYHNKYNLFKNWIDLIEEISTDNSRYYNVIENKNVTFLVLCLLNICFVIFISLKIIDKRNNAYKT